MPYASKRLRRVFIAIDNSGCSAAECELTYGDNRYTVDFDALERRAADPAVKLMLLCNPHNPAGRVWTPDELRHINDLCLRHNVPWIDCQQNTAHLAFLGGRQIARDTFLQGIARSSQAPALDWKFSPLYWDALLQRPCPSPDSAPPSLA